MSDSETAEKLQLVIKSSGDKKYDVSVTSETTVSELKQLLVEKSGISADRQRLIYSGRVLKDPDTLSNYKVKSGHAIHLVKGAAQKNPATQSSNNPESTEAPAQQPAAPRMAAGQGAGNVLADLTGARYSGLANLPSADIFGPDGGQGPQPSMDQMLDMMENPEVMSSVEHMLSDPDFFLSQNPRMRDLPPEQYRRIRETISSPMFRELFTNPDRMRRLTGSLRNIMGSGGLPPLDGMDPLAALGIPPGGAAPGATGDGSSPGAGLIDPFEAFRRNYEAPQDTRPPEERYETQLRQLNEMGFHDFDRNVRALRRSGGNVEGAVEALFDGNV